MVVWNGNSIPLTSIQDNAQITATNLEANLDPLKSAHK